MKTGKLLGSAYGLVVVACAAALLCSGCDTEEASAPTGMGQCGLVIESLTATPGSVTVGDSTTICAHVLNRDGTRAASGVTVEFGRSGRTSGGSFAAVTTVTDANGYACAVYRSSAADLGMIDLKAVAGDCAYKYVTLVVQATGDGGGDGLEVGISAVESAIPADGVSTLDLTISVTREGMASADETVTLAAGERFTDVDGNGVFSDGDILLIDGDADGLWDAIGTIPPSVVTGTSGEAIVSYTAGAEETTLYVKATVDTVSADFAITLHPVESNVAVTASPAEMLADGVSSSIIVADVSDSEGNPLVGKLVRFTAGEPFDDDNGDGSYTSGENFSDLNQNGSWDVIGQITTSGNTGENGTIAVVYKAGLTPGEVTIYAATQEERASTTVMLLELPAVDSIEYDWNPDQVYADGSSQSQLAVTVYDVNGGKIAGKQIKFVAGEPFTDNNGNGEFDEGVDDLGDEIIANGEWDALGTIDASAITDVVGRLWVTYTASTTPGEIAVKASAGDWSFDIPLIVAELPDVISIASDANPAAIVASGVSGQDWSTISAICQGEGGIEVPAGVPVTFEISSGPGGGESFAPDGTASVTALTDAYGEAIAIITSGSVPGTVEIRVSSGAAVTNTVVEILSDGTIRQIVLTAEPTDISVYGIGSSDHSVLKATCYLDLSSETTAPAGYPVDFSIIAGPGGGEELLGELGGADVPTNEYGVAQITLRSGTLAGPITVRAAAGDAVHSVYLSISAGPPTGVYWLPHQSSVGYGEAVENMKVLVHDAHHNPVPDGTRVVLSANCGLLRGDDGTGAEETVAGEIICHFFAPAAEDDPPSVAELYAKVIGADHEEITGTTYMDLPLGDPSDEPGPIATLQIQLSTSEIGVRGTGAVEQCYVAATCFDAQNRLVGKDREVEFEILAGPGGGEGLLEDGWGPVTVLTDESSMAVVTLLSGTISGTVEVQARAVETQASKSTLVSINAGPPVYISVGVSPQNIRGWDVVGAEAELIAIVSDIYNNPVREGTVVYFTVDEGIVRGNYEIYGVLGSSVTDGGIGKGTYFSGLPRDDGDVLVTVSTSGGTVIGTDWFISSGPPTSVTFVSPAPPPAPAPTLWADGESEIQMWVEVLDINDNFVLAGTGVEWRTDVGTVTETSQTADGVYGSLAESDYRSETLSEDSSWTTPDDGIGAIAHVTASAGLGGAASDLLEIYLLTSNAYRQNSSIEFESASVGANASVPFDVIIKDRFGNPLGGHLLSLSTSDGTVTESAITDRWGTAGNLIFTAPDDSLKVYITVQDEDPGYGGITLSQEITVQ